MDFCAACNAQCATAAKGLHAMKGAGKMTSEEALEVIVRKHCVSNTDKEDSA